MPANYGDHSEYNGGGVQPNTLFPKELDNMSVAERLRLQSITGQDDDPKALPDPTFWVGAQVQDPVMLEQAARIREATIRQQERIERDRYDRSKH